MVGLVARTTLPVPVVALPAGVPVKDGLESVGEDIVGLVARTTFPVPVVALPVGVPVKDGLESVGEDIVGLVARTMLPLPVVALARSVAAEDGLAMDEMGIAHVRTPVTSSFLIPTYAWNNH